MSAAKKLENINSQFARKLFPFSDTPDLGSRVTPYPPPSTQSFHLGLQLDNDHALENFVGHRSQPIFRTLALVIIIMLFTAYNAGPLKFSGSI